MEGEGLSDSIWVKNNILILEFFVFLYFMKFLALPLLAPNPVDNSVIDTHIHLYMYPYGTD